MDSTEELEGLKHALQTAEKASTAQRASAAQKDLNNFVMGSWPKISAHGHPNQMPAGWIAQPIGTFLSDFESPWDKPADVDVPTVHDEVEDDHVSRFEDITKDTDTEAATKPKSESKK